MNPTDFIWIGGIVAAVGAGWNSLKAWWAQLASLFVVTINTNGWTTTAMLIYLRTHFTQPRSGPQTYIGRLLGVKASGRVQLVAWRTVGRAGMLYLSGWKPLWVSALTSQKDDPVPSAPAALSIQFLRGTFSADRLVIDAKNYFNQLRDDPQNNERRHFIKRVYGLSKKRAMLKEDNAESKAVRSSSSDLDDLRGFLPLDVSVDDLKLSDDRSRLEYLALSPEAEDAIAEARRWIKSEKWYRSKGLSWRRSWLIHGSPGNGKTALARALAEELDLPVFIFDLASLANDEFQSAWGEMLSSAPCLALLEDVDSVFEGRVNRVGDLTFDCFLNCLDGMERADGLFVVITTNHPDKLDPALGVPGKDGKSTRPGRVDRTLQMDNPTPAGRLKIARRILEGYSELDRVVCEGEGETGSQFQERCARFALDLYWTRKA